MTNEQQKTGDDCISRAYIEPIIEELENICVNGDEHILDLLADIKNAPPVKPKEPKTGHWIDDEFGSKCSCCGIYTHLDKFDRPMKFRCCSMCGAKMVEPQESEEV